MNLVQAQDRQAERLSELGRINKDSIVLDLGCGSGVNSIFLAEKYGCRVLGIDISMGMLAMAREQLKRCSPEVQTKVSFYQGTLTELVEALLITGLIRTADGCVQSKGWLVRGATGNEPRATSHSAWSHVRSDTDWSPHDDVSNDSLSNADGGSTTYVQPSFTHLWSTLTHFQIRPQEREQLLVNFNNIATADAYLVIDDALCLNKVISARSQRGIYDRLQLERLWSPTEYTARMESAGYHTTIEEDCTAHCRRTYEHLKASAEHHEENSLAMLYQETLHGIDTGDFTWHVFIAQRGAAFKDTRASQSMSSPASLTDEEKMHGWRQYKRSARDLLGSMESRSEVNMTDNSQLNMMPWGL